MNKTLYFNSQGQNPNNFMAKIPPMTLPPDTEVAITDGRLFVSSKIDINSTNDSFVFTIGTTGELDGDKHKSGTNKLALNKNRAFYIEPQLFTLEHGTFSLTSDYSKGADYLDATSFSMDNRIQLTVNNENLTVIPNTDVKGELWSNFVKAMNNQNPFKCFAYSGVIENIGHGGKSSGWGWYSYQPNFFTIGCNLEIQNWIEDYLAIDDAYSGFTEVATETLIYGEYDQSGADGGVQDAVVIANVDEELKEFNTLFHSKEYINVLQDYRAKSDIWGKGELTTELYSSSILNITLPEITGLGEGIQRDWWVAIYPEDIKASLNKAKDGAEPQPNNNCLYYYEAGNENKKDININKNVPFIVFYAEGTTIYCRCNAKNSISGKWEHMKTLSVGTYDGSAQVDIGLVGYCRSAIANDLSTYLIFPTIDKAIRGNGAVQHTNAFCFGYYGDANNGYANPDKLQTYLLPSSKCKLSINQSISMNDEACAYFGCFYSDRDYHSLEKLPFRQSDGAGNYSYIYEDGDGRLLTQFSGLRSAYIMTPFYKVGTFIQTKNTGYETDGSGYMGSANNLTLGNLNTNFIFGKINVGRTIESTPEYRCGLDLSNLTEKSNFLEYVYSEQQIVSILPKDLNYDSDGIVTLGNLKNTSRLAGFHIVLENLPILNITGNPLRGDNLQIVYTDLKPVSDADDDSQDEVVIEPKTLIYHKIDTPIPRNLNYIRVRLVNLDGSSYQSAIGTTHIVLHLQSNRMDSLLKMMEKKQIPLEDRMENLTKINSINIL